MKKIAMLLAAGVAVVMGVVALPAPASAAWVNPFPHKIRYAPFGEDSSFPAALVTSIAHPGKIPIGANDWSCTPSRKHPRPVVLVHGTWENAYDNWNGLSPILKDKGYCVYALNYGNTTGIGFLNGTGDMIESAEQIGPFVARVLASTGTSDVDLIGHSQGGAIARYYTNILGGDAEVNQLIAITASNHPTTLSGITDLGRTLNILGAALDLLDLVEMPAAVQQADTDPPSEFYQQLNGDGETVPGMTYTNIGTKYDEVVTPWRGAFVTAGPGASVDNIKLQDVCSIDLSEHLSVNYSKNVAQIVLNKLDPSDQRRVFCYPQAPLTGNTQLFG